MSELIQDCYLPFHVKLKHYDGVVISSEEDEDLADKLVEILKKFAHFKDSGSNVVTPEVTTIYSEEFYEASSIYDKIDKAMKNSNYVFMLITRSLIEDQRFLFIWSSAVELNFCPERSGNIIPVFKSRKEKSELDIPCYLRTLEDVILDNLVKDCGFDLIDVNSLNQDSFTKRYIRRIGNIFSEKYCIRQKHNSFLEAQKRQCLENITTSHKNVESNGIRCQKETRIFMKNNSPKEVLYPLQKNALNTSILIEEDNSPDDSDEFGCPLYILIEDDEDCGDESQINTCREVTRQLPHTEESKSHLQHAGITKDTALKEPNSHHRVKIKPIMKVQPFHQVKENPKNNESLPHK